jgi:hypothetical protein
MTLVLTHREWTNIYRSLVNELGISAILSWNLKENFGFTVRHHRGYDTLKDRWLDDVRLDFYQESALTFFRLKYYDQLDKVQNNYD